MKISHRAHRGTEKNKIRSRTEAQRHREKKMVCEIFCPQIFADFRRLKDLFFKIALYRTENTFNLNIKNLRTKLIRFNFFVFSVPLCLCEKSSLCLCARSSLCLCVLCENSSFIFWGST
jgi:hypothetical protein